MAVIDKTNVSPKLTPTDKPIIKYTDKSGNSYMAREVQLENGYKCMNLLRRQPQFPYLCFHPAGNPAREVSRPPPATGGFPGFGPQPDTAQTNGTNNPK